MLKPLKSSPMSSSWKFRGAVRGYRFFSSRNGKTYAQDVKSGQWFQWFPEAGGQRTTADVSDAKTESK